MGAGSYYQFPERKIAGLVLMLCTIFYVFLFLLTFLLRNCGGLTDGWSVSVWHALNVGIEYTALGLAALALFALFIVPLWYFERKGKESGEMAFEAAKNTAGLVILVGLLSSFFILPTVGLIDDRDVSTRLQHFENYYDIGSNEFRAFMVPRPAKDIKVYVDHRIGSRSCDISCTVGMEGLLEFAKENGYRFERREHILGLADSCVTRELEIDTANITNYLFSAVGLQGDASEGSAKSSFGHVLFVYDIANNKLFGSYSD